MNQTKGEGVAAAITRWTIGRICYIRGVHTKNERLCLIWLLWSLSVNPDLVAKCRGMF